MIPMRMPDPPAELLNRVHRGDCLDVLRQLPDESIGLVMTSPPYNLRNSSGGGTDNPGRSAKWTRSRFLTEGYEGFDDAMPEAEYLEYQATRFDEAMRVLRHDGAMFVVFKWRQQHGLLQDRRELWGRYPVRQVIIWARPGGINFNPGYFVGTYELVYLIVKPAFRLRARAGNLGDFWKLRPDRHDPAHYGLDGLPPPTFPLELARRRIRSCPDNGVVLDPYLGIGTTAVAAEACGRSWIGIEQSEQYCGAAEQRLEESRHDDR